MRRCCGTDGRPCHNSVCYLIEYAEVGPVLSRFLRECFRGQRRGRVTARRRPDATEWLYVRSDQVGRRAGVRAARRGAVRGGVTHAFGAA